jgi:ribosomal protein S27AE
MAARYGAEMAVPDWHKRLVCGQCGSRRVDFVCSGEKRRPLE